MSIQIIYRLGLIAPIIGVLVAIATGIAVR